MKEQERGVAAFYDGLASDYHLNYTDWDEAVLRQGRVLAGIIDQHGIPNTATVLDCACGIGIQSLGLANVGFRVTASDVSPRSIERARIEAAARNLSIPFHVVDFRFLAAHIKGRFDVVICCDNSLPHLTTDADLATVTQNMYAKTNPGGIVVIGIRDYDALIRERPQTTAPHVIAEPDGRSITFQVWDWQSNAPTYDVNLFVVKQWQSAVQARCHTTRYRALLRHELDSILADAGFVESTWLLPPETHHHQPLVIARRPNDRGEHAPG